MLIVEGPERRAGVRYFDRGQAFEFVDGCVSIPVRRLPDGYTFGVCLLCIGYPCECGTAGEGC